MKKLFMLLVILFIFYLGIQIVFKLFSKGYSDEYIIKVQDIEFYINETSNFKNNNYYFKISGGINEFKFQIHNDFNKHKTVIEKIEYFKDDEYECILPIFKNNTIISDVMCIKNNVTYYYHDIKTKNKSLDYFVSKINNYDSNKYNDIIESINIENIDIYKENLINDHYIGITNYKGLYNISKNFNSVVYNISLFNKDIYNQKIGAFIDKYYVVADYDKEFEFNEFKVIDLVNLNVEKITTDRAITFDSYIQGVVDNKVYLFDKDRQVQFEINVENKNIIKNNKDNIRHYNKGEFSTITLKEALDELKFIYYDVEYQNEKYERIDKVGLDTGYYYLYKKNEKSYDAYRINIQDKEGLTYLFTTNTIDNIFYIDNYVYFINNNKVQVYNDNFGIRNIAKYKELEFNKNIIFNVYSK